jgi:hypothetical protein
MRAHQMAGAQFGLYQLRGLSHNNYLLHWMMYFKWKSSGDLSDLIRMFLQPNFTLMSLGSNHHEIATINNVITLDP